MTPLIPCRSCGYRVARVLGRWVHVWSGAAQCNYRATVAMPPVAWLEQPDQQERT